MVTGFEKSNNVKAFYITLLFTALLILIFIFLKWPLPKNEIFVQQDFIEVNLGNNELGFGNDQPQLTEEPTPQTNLNNSPPATIVANNSKEFETNEKDEIAPAIKSSPIKKTTVAKINTEPKPVKAKPKAILGKIIGEKGTEANAAETYKPGTSEGITKGKTDQGINNGTPGAPNYSGSRKNFGVKILQIADQSFEDEFNENAKVAIDIIAEANGIVSAANYQARGSTTTNRKLIEIARRRAFELKLGSSENGQKGTVIFNFKLKN